MLVRIHMIERQSGRRESLELGRDLGRKLFSHARAQKDVEAEPGHVGSKAPVSGNKVGQLIRAEDRPPLDEREVQAYAQARHAASPRHRVGRCWLRDHEAGGSENAVSMRRFNRLVDLGREAEIIRRDDEAPQAATSRRSRRKRKNSMPSRRRRFIISGLRTISPTIDAIFGARK